MRELHLPQPAGAVLLWPYADFTFSGETIHTNGDIDMLPSGDRPTSATLIPRIRWSRPHLPIWTEWHPC